MFPSEAGSDPADLPTPEGLPPPPPQPPPESTSPSRPSTPPAASKGKPKPSEKERLDAAVVGACAPRSLPLTPQPRFIFIFFLIFIFPFLVVDRDLKTNRQTTTPLSPSEASRDCTPGPMNPSSSATLSGSRNEDLQLSVSSSSSSPPFRLSFPLVGMFPA